MRGRLVLLFAIVLVIAEDWVADEDSGPDFSYPENKDNGWGGWCSKGEAGSRKQSPVNLEGDVKARDTGIDIKWSPHVGIKGDDNGKTIAWKPYDSKKKTERRRHMGHAIMWDATVKRMEKFYLRHFLVHTRSEHKIAGKASDLEIQFVHTREDLKDESGAEEKLTYGIISMLCDVEKESKGDDKKESKGDDKKKEKNELEGFFKIAMKSAKSKEPQEIELEMVLAEKLKTYLYFNYTGSLTTPPCDEDVNWVIMGEECVVPKSFADFLKDKSAMKDNYRGLQDLNDRSVWSSDEQPPNENQRDADEEEKQENEDSENNTDKDGKGTSKDNKNKEGKGTDTQGDKGTDKQTDKDSKGTQSKDSTDKQTDKDSKGTQSKDSTDKQTDKETENTDSATDNNTKKDGEENDTKKGTNKSEPDDTDNGNSDSNTKGNSDKGSKNKDNATSLVKKKSSSKAVSKPTDKTKENNERGSHSNNAKDSSSGKKSSTKNGNKPKTNSKEKDGSTTSEKGEDGEQVGHVTDVKHDDVEILDYEDVPDLDETSKQDQPAQPSKVIADSEGVDGDAVSSNGLDEDSTEDDDVLYTEEDFSGIDDFLDVEVQQSLPDVMKGYVNYALVFSLVVSLGLYAYCRNPQEKRQTYEAYQLIDDEI